MFCALSPSSLGVPLSPTNTCRQAREDFTLFSLTIRTRLDFSRISGGIRAMVLNSPASEMMMGAWISTSPLLRCTRTPEGREYTWGT